MIFYCIFYTLFRHRGIVGRVPAFQLVGPGSIPRAVRNFNVYPLSVYLCSALCCLRRWP